MTDQNSNNNTQPPPGYPTAGPTGNPADQVDTRANASLTWGDMHTLFSSISQFQQSTQANTAAIQTQGAMIQGLLQHLVSLPQPQPQQPRIPPKPTFKEPAVFKAGMDVESWISDVQDAIMLQADALPTEEHKCTFTATYLAEGDPKQWYKAKKKLDVTFLSNFEEFLRIFIKRFGDPDLRANALRKIRQLHQTGSAASYGTKFSNLLPYLDYSEETKCDMFYEGLKPVLKDYITVSPRSEIPKTFDEYVQWVTGLDNRLHVRQGEGGSVLFSNAGTSSGYKSSNGNHNGNHPTSSHPHTHTSTPASTSTLPPGDPMEIDATKTGRPRGPLSEAEKKRRMDHGLCLYCGGSGHKAGDCPNKSSSKGKGKASNTTNPKAGPSSGKA
jgi:hypothetical protein